MRLGPFREARALSGIARRFIGSKSNSLARVPSAFLLRAMLVAVGYFLLAKGGLALASLHPSASPVWPSSGFALAALLLWGNGLWPAIALAAFLANATTFGSLTTSFFIAAGNTLEGVVTAVLLNRWAGGLNAFDTPARAVTFAGLTLAPGTMISATLGVGSLHFAGFAEADSLANVWMTWWLGDVGGQLLVTPAIVLWTARRFELAATDDLQRLALLMGTTIMMGLVVFSPLAPEIAARGPLAFLVVIPLLWAALRHGQRDTATVALVLCLFAIFGTLANGGPFARANLNDSFLLVVAFVIAVSVPSLVLSADVAERRLSEERHRALVEHANDIVATLDLDFRFTWVNPAIERVLGYAPSEIIGTALSEYVPEDQLAMHQAMLQRKLGGEASTQYEMQLLSKDRRQRFTLEVNSKLMRDAHGNPVGIHSISRDITDRKDAEARQLVLIRELQHRTKNLLSVVQSIVSNTLARTPSSSAAKEAIIGRLHALSHAQEFVASGGGAGIPLRSLVETELAGFDAQYTAQGIPVVLGPAFAQQFALVLHELATNAAKYGALSVPQGKLSITWHVDGEGEPCLVFSWTERGGPLVEPPRESGFGTELISIALNGRPKLAYKAHGLEFVVRVPMTEVVRSSN